MRNEVAHRLQHILVNYLSRATSMKFFATPKQIRAAAKQIQRSGSLPAPVAQALSLNV